eukprot:CAMPEP_0197187660 /NCGR_PEP_ID=MMETSP1423-20130617/16286_1 /TAXON_ID=476441 /ORGANISM="Pseudo-nitzschia heimii, Strain UNC1101" /LENGTH=604 /DNA_ID=CAMNT_0042639297 /DNA_START=8 /DNA_END=1819 /DNA_ORIENTATION=-
MFANAFDNAFCRIDRPGGDLRPKMIVAEEEDSGSESGDPITNLQINFHNNESTANLSDSQTSDFKPNLQMSVHSSSELKANLQMSLHSSLGTRASRTDLYMPANEFAEGCKLLQAAALGKKVTMEAILEKRPRFVDFRDYDRRTAMHVAASEGHLEIVKFLVRRGARINRSDRWGGSPLDDASRHRNKEVIQYLRLLGASTGSASSVTNFIKAAAEGDFDEVEMLLMSGDIDVNEGDYDKRTALHLAAGEGNVDIVRLLCNKKANVNTEDRWGNRPLDDADRGKSEKCAQVLKEFGAKNGHQQKDLSESISRRRETANLEVKFEELEMVDKIGKGSFGEIYRCRWRDIMVAAKCIRTAKVEKDWAIKQALQQLEAGADVDDVIHEIDNASMPESDKRKALSDFRTEISILKSLRHPNIVLLLAYSTTKDVEVMISELMRCSLLDIFKAHIINGTKMSRKDQIAYAIQLAQGMLYLHTCKPPVIHRDLKPANLLIDHSGVLKVADFGLSKVRPDPKKNEKDTFLMTGETGSYRFMAPEIYRHLSYNETVDIYSYGMILFYLLDGKPPWSALNGLVAARKASEEGDRPRIPRGWDNRIQVLLQECW